MAKQSAWLVCILFAWAGMAHALAPAPVGTAPARHPPLLKVQDESQNGLAGPDRSPACAAIGGVGSDTDCRRNGVQVDPNSGEALSADDQCTSVGGTTDGEACFRDGTQINPDTGDELQPGDPGYVPQQSDDQNQQGQDQATPDQDQSSQDQAAPDQDQGSQDQSNQDETAPQSGGSDSGAQDSAPPAEPSSSSSDNQ